MAGLKEKKNPIGIEGFHGVTLVFCIKTCMITDQLNFVIIYSLLR